MRILAIGASLRSGSYRRLLQAAAADATPELELHTWDGLAFVPPFNEDLEAAPPPLAVADLKRAIEAADSVLIATPEYNGSARVVGPEFAVPRVHERFDADGQLSDDLVRARLRELLAELALATTHVVAAA
jgi:NADPH-dependent FMN reductase